MHIYQNPYREAYKNFLMDEILEQAEMQQDNPTPAMANSIVSLSIALQEHLEGK